MNINIKTEKINVDNIKCGDLIIDNFEEVFTIMKFSVSNKYAVIRLSDNRVSDCFF